MTFVMNHSSPCQRRRCWARDQRCKTGGREFTGGARQPNSRGVGTSLV